MFVIALDTLRAELKITRRKLNEINEYKKRKSLKLIFMKKSNENLTKDDRMSVLNVDEFKFFLI